MPFRHKDPMPRSKRHLLLQRIVKRILIILLNQEWIARKGVGDLWINSWRIRRSIKFKKRGNWLKWGRKLLDGRINKSGVSLKSTLVQKTKRQQYKKHQVSLKDCQGKDTLGSCQVPIVLVPASFKGQRTFLDSNLPLICYTKMLRDAASTKRLQDKVNKKRSRLYQLLKSTQTPTIWYVKRSSLSSCNWLVIQW